MISLVGLISFGLCYYNGPVTNERGINLIQWTIQLIATYFIYKGVQPDALSVFVVIIVYIYSFLSSARVEGMLNLLPRNLWVSMDLNNWNIFYIFYICLYKLSKSKGGVQRRSIFGFYSYLSGFSLLSTGNLYVGHSIVLHGLYDSAKMSKFKRLSAWDVLRVMIVSKVNKQSTNNNLWIIVKTISVKIIPSFVHHRKFQPNPCLSKWVVLSHVDSLLLNIVDVIYAYFFCRISYKVRYYLFPPKTKLMTADEYEAEGLNETRKALLELREYCNSPDCDAWKVISRVRNPKRFVTLISSYQKQTDRQTKKQANKHGRSSAEYEIQRGSFK